MKPTLFDKKNDLIKIFPEFDNYWTFNLEPLATSTQKTNLSILVKFFDIIGKHNPRDMTESDIKKFIKGVKFGILSNKSKNLYIIIIKKYLKYFDVDLKFPKYVEQSKELNKNDLINREELDIILSICNTKKKAMVMVLYEAGLRRKELVNIRYKDIVFERDLANLYVQESKTRKRNIPLIESIPYLKEYFMMNKLSSDDFLWGYHPQNITMFFKKLTERLKRIYPEWNKELYPHLLRHSRLTELAATRLNEPQLRKFAGWSADSDMPKVYFHLDDSDLRKLLLDNDITPQKSQNKAVFTPIICKVCNTKNSAQNAFCYKCGNIINKDKVNTERIQEQLDMDELSDLIKSNPEFKSNLNILLKMLIRTKKIKGA